MLWVEACEGAYTTHLGPAILPKETHGVLG